MALHKKSIPLELLRRSSRLPQLSNTCIDRDKKDVNLPETRPAKRVKTEQIADKVRNESKKIEKQITIKQETESCDINLQGGDDIPQPDGLLDVHADELDLERTLLGGQSFRWNKQVNFKIQPVFTGVILDRALQLWRASTGQVAYRVLNKLPESKLLECPTKALLEDYFQLKYNLGDLYQEWSAKDPHLEACCKQYRGFRILRQDPVENVFSFICATNNNIKRISQMVDKLCKRYGDILEARNDSDKLSIYDLHRSFPSVERLAEDDVFETLRYELGFGYRAKFITGTAKQLIELKEKDNKISVRNYLLSLRQLPYKETCKTLMKFPGIGRKVADCICLMSMDHLDAVPIDCHIYEIVVRNYMPNLRSEHKTLTENVHDLIGDHFKSIHGPLSGWSTSVLFIAELKHLKSEGGSMKKVAMKKKKAK